MVCSPRPWPARVRSYLFLSWRCLWVSALACTLAAGVAVAQEDLLGRALEDLQAGNAQAAFDRLNPAQSSRAGEPDYDYLLGMSALGAGRNTEAIFALERVLALRPGDLKARVAMGRAHLALQETEAARREFQTVQSLDGSAATRAIIQRYLNVTEQIEAAGRFSAQMYLEFTAGHDSNVNSASTIGQVAIPALGGQSFQISESSRRQGDTFLSLAGGLNVRGRLSPRTSLVGGFAVSQRLHFVETQYELSTLDLSLGLIHSRGLNQYAATLQLGQIHINHPDYTAGYRDSAGVTLQWVRNLEGNAQWSNYYQFARLDYPGQEPRDAWRHVLGAAYAKGMDNGLTAFAGLYAGLEKALDDDFRALGHELAGGRLGGDYAWSNRVGLYLNASYEMRKYRDEDASFMLTRKDHQYALAMGLNYALNAKGWRVSPQLSYTKVESNIPINSFGRLVSQVTIRGDL